jgi:8-oxo-dGTP pyrophosphatase MutT (NUDIX family)
VVASPSEAAAGSAAVRPPFFRPTARCFVVDQAGRLLLFGGTISATAAPRRAWLTPGGGVRAGESLPQAAARELAEETGLRRRSEDLGPVIAVCAGIWWAGSQPFFGVDSYFLVRSDEIDLDAARPEEQERAALATHRWWTADELDATADRVFPLGVVSLLRSVLAGELSELPVRLQWRTHRTTPRSAEASPATAAG